MTRGIATLTLHRLTPAWYAVVGALAVAASWVGLALTMGSELSDPFRVTAEGMTDMAMTPSTTGSWLFGLAGWIQMTVAMMGVVAIPGILHTAHNSLRWRRRRAVIEFAGGYLVAWSVFGVMAVAVTRDASLLHQPLVFGVLLCVAAWWELTPWKMWSLQECHRSFPLPVRGWRAERGSLNFGLRNGIACVGSCWALMLTMAFVSNSPIAWMLGGTSVVVAQRFSERPLRALRISSYALGGCGLAVLLVAYFQPG